jgi:hypothetical protein
MSKLSSCLCATVLLLGPWAAAVEAGERPVLRPGEIDFAERPAWQKRLDRIARHGLPFAALRENRDSKLVVGMHPDGYFGVFLMPRTN